MLDKKVSNQKRQMTVFNTAAKPGLDGEESDSSCKEEGNRKHSTLTHQGNPTHSKKAWHGTALSINCGELVDSCIELTTICTIKLGRVKATTSSQSNDPKTEINNRADTTVLGSN